MCASYAHPDVTSPTRGLFSMRNAPYARQRLWHWRALKASWTVKTAKQALVIDGQQQKSMHRWSYTHEVTPTNFMSQDIIGQQQRNCCCTVPILETVFIRSQLTKPLKFKINCIGGSPDQSNCRMSIHVMNIYSTHWPRSGGKNHIRVTCAPTSN